MNRRHFLGAAAAGSIAFATKPARAASETIRVLVPDSDNLQYMSFWLAQAAFFQEAGMVIEIISPPAPQQARAWIDDKKPDAAVLPPPMYLELIADRAPWVLGANLLANDPIDLVVRKSVATAKGITRDLPLRERLEKLRGVKIGIAPHPPPRLRALYASAGLDANHDAELVIVGGKRQNAAFENGDVDALYAHTPFLEHAILHQDAIVIVDQAGGEIRELANRQIHALMFSRSFLERRKGDAAAMVRAIAQAETLLRQSPADAATKLAALFPTRDKGEIDLIAHLYSKAIPASPVVRADAFQAALVFFPEGQDPPKLEGIDLSAFVAPELANVPPPASRFRFAELGVATVAVGLAALAYKIRSGRRRDPSADQK